MHVTVSASDHRVSQPELIARVLAGDRVAARELYDAHAPRVYRLAYRLTGDAELARESTQDVFVRAFQRLASFRGDAALGTWLHRITVTVVLSAREKQKRQDSREVSLDDWNGNNAVSNGNVDPILRERLHRAINELPDAYRVTLIMHDMEGYKHHEIAEILGVAEGTCKSRLSLARARLRAMLQDLAEEAGS